MAKINGIEIKAMKNFKDHEGLTIYQGNIYYNGKKLGFWSQDSYGGMDNYDFNTNILKDEVEKFKNSDMVEDKFRKFADLDILLDELVKLKETEKQYNHFFKKGFASMVLVTDGYHYFYMASHLADKDAVLKEMDTQIKESKKRCFKNLDISVDVYTSSDDFNIQL